MSKDKELTKWDCIHFERTAINVSYCRRLKRVCLYDSEVEKCVAFITRAEVEEMSKDNSVAAELAKKAMAYMEMGGDVCG